MATGYVIHPIAGATLPDGSSNNAPAQFQRTKSSAAAPSPHFVELLFDPNTNEHCSWSYTLPGNYASAPILRVQAKANATSGNAIIGCRISAVTPGDADTPNEHGIGTANTATWAANATEARRLVEQTITLSNIDGMVAGDEIVLQFYRDASNGSDTLSVDLEVTAVTLEYTTT